MKKDFKKFSSGKNFCYLCNIKTNHKRIQIQNNMSTVNNIGKNWEAIAMVEGNFYAIAGNENNKVDYKDFNNSRHDDLTTI